MIEDMRLKPTATIRLKREESKESKTNRPVITTILQHPCETLAKALPREAKYEEETELSLCLLRKPKKIN